MLPSGGHLLVEFIIPVGAAIIHISAIGGGRYFRQGRIIMPTFQFGKPGLQIGRERESVIHAGRIGNIVIVSVIRLNETLRPCVTVPDIIIALGLGIEGHISGIREGCLSLRWILCRDEHDTEGSPGTINGRRGSILQDSNRFNITGIQEIRIAGCAINHNQRASTSCSDRGRSTDIVFGTSDGFPVRHINIQARNHSLQSTGKGRHRQILHGFATEALHTTGQIDLFLHTVTHDHHLFELSDIVFQDKIQPRCRLPGYGFISNQKGIHPVAIGHTHTIVSVQVGRRALRSAVDHHGRPDKRLSVAIHHPACHPHARLDRQRRISVVVKL